MFENRNYMFWLKKCNMFFLDIRHIVIFSILLCINITYDSKAMIQDISFENGNSIHMEAERDNKNDQSNEEGFRNSRSTIVNEEKKEDDNPQGEQYIRPSTVTFETLDQQEFNDILYNNRYHTCCCCCCTKCLIISLALASGISSAGLFILIYFLSRQENKNDEQDEEKGKCFDGEIKKELIQRLKDTGYKENEDFFFDDNIYDKYAGYYIFSLNNLLDPKDLLFKIQTQDTADLEKLVGKKKMKYFIKQLKKDSDENIKKKCFFIIKDPKNVFSYNNIGLKNLFSIKLIQEGSNKLTTMEGMFANCRNLISIDFNIADISNVTNMSSLFLNCEKIKNINLKLELSEKVTTMSRAFEGCENLEQINLEKIKTHNVEDMRKLVI